VIKHLKSGKFRLYTADGSRPLGPPTTHEKAAAQEAAIKASQHSRHAERNEPMPRKLAGWAARKVKNARRQTGKAMSDEDVVATIQREAKAAGATLANDGKGGLDPRLALERFRAARWKCGNKFCPTPNEDLDLDHTSGHPKEIFESLKSWQNPKLRAAATKANGPKDDRFVSVLCRACHDCCHQRERAIENGKSPPPMRGTP